MDDQNFRTVQAEVANIAAKYGLTTAELATLLGETDRLRGLLGPRDVEAGLQQVLQVWIGALQSTAERIESVADRLIVDRFLGQAMEMLAGQLEAAPHRAN